MNQWLVKMLNNINDVDQFIRSLTRGRYYNINRFYNCSEINPKWNGSTVSQLTLLYRGMPEEKGVVRKYSSYFDHTKKTKLD